METSKFVSTAQAFIKKYQHLSKVKADAPNGVPEGESESPNMEEICNYIQDLNFALVSLSYDINYLFSSFSKHQEGHLPPIQGAGQMEKALKNLGISADYQIMKPVVFANRGNEIVASIDVTVNQPK